MKNTIIIPSGIAATLRRQFFQNEVEQGAFLFAEAKRESDGLHLVVADFYLVPARGWEVQMEVYLQMKDSERAKIMKLARENNLCAIDCHSHPHAEDDVWFSLSDVAGISDFAQYAKWKLNGKPFAAMVWGEKSVDAVLWRDDFAHAERVALVKIIGNTNQTLIPTGSWFNAPRGKHRFATYE
ncbi:MAG: hypothetical protein DME22_00375 [Verrucomicrobia bacterium]|nr:MAG: hypothetical protein DME22_00375 [Verrucomicrobiota bacterium]PYJ96337.1 MAG: hypothetical protein DME23_21135 [Verrucomicrobiota bacterium]